STLRDFGLGKKSLEQWVTEEATCLCAAMADQEGRPFSPNSLLNKSVGNVIASLIFGHRFEYDDPRFMNIVNMMETALKEENIFLQQVLNSMPVILHIPGLAAKILEGPKIFMNTLGEMIAEHRLGRDTDQPPRDLTDAFLDQVEKVSSGPWPGRGDHGGGPVCCLIQWSGTCFLFFTRLLQRFRFSVPAGQPPPSDYGVFAVLVTPAPYQLCAVPR
ncbi:PREDICTED: cytochrome P450 2D17, partial [Condylura cristata]|uniref:cytochrome P450 2D17 n=1 Tax=Condylura cristata TaxID=143302 RepID=UPI0006430317